MAELTSFNIAAQTLFRQEGGFGWDANDPGGATNFGVSLRWLKTVSDVDHDGWLDGDLDHDGDVDGDDIRSLTEVQAMELYRAQWWDRYGYARFVDQSLATKMLSLAVNMGPGRAHQMLQRALRAAGKRVSEDGVLGPITVAAANDYAPRGVLVALRSEAAGFYRSLNQPKFIDGWLNRAYA